MLHPNTFNPTECHCRFKYIFWHTVTLKMEIRSHFLEVQCQGNLGAVSSAWVLFVPLHNVSGDNAFWNVFPSRDWNTQSFQRRKFLWLYFMPIFWAWTQMEKCQKFPTEKIFHEEKQNVKEAVGEVSQQEPPLPLRQYWWWSPPQNPTATSPSPLWTDHLQPCCAFARPCVTELPWAFSRINCALLLNWFQGV